ncbi:LysR family transcriptional regulator [Clostridium botulinum]|uniref:LysR-family transcriptional regulator n=1 Tax=Clostridium botulinum (strain Eklund 17B / Type B) TaxID=935198 RepID=B2TNN2_CLOBB|nr:LysR-family transcriptional regulator [Clostridium botulinum B str. Eklund 17B (NRP)]MBY6976160.1 LysR family transcriptional regulator [Clostridium botulinum]MBY7000584.1 LysR family transcriptional regulator [Clostridium botulinum]MCR1273345.1 LysR family transcriptional regulator [Clostridium botulinum]NFD70442.1 LysR family transcriptional regulator [Clostridium botulinum]
MNFRKLKIFYETATELNMTSVAKKLYISQPSISQAIHEIEDELEVRLFDRIGKKLYLTHEGEIYLNYTRRILNLYDESIRTINDINTNEKGKIKIGASTTIGIYILPDIIKGFLKEHSGIEISLAIDNTSNIEKMILENKIDFAYIEGTTNLDEIVQAKVWEDELIFISSLNHSWSKKEMVSTKDIIKEKLIMREQGSGTREIIEAYLKNNNIDYKIFMELGNTEAIKKSVEANLGVSCLSSRSVDEKIKSGCLKGYRLKEGKITRDLRLIHHRDKFLNKNMKNFISYSLK